MGSYCEYKLGGWQIESSKSYIFPELIEPFHEMDRKVNYIKEEGETYRKVRYINNAKNIQMRLDALGYTVKKAELFLINGREQWIQENSYLLPDPKSKAKKIYMESSINDWIEAYRLIRENDWRRPYFYSSDDKWQSDQMTPLVRIALATEETFYGLSIPPQYVLRLFLESCSPDLHIELDVSELVYGGYYGAREKIVKNNKIGEKIILLTEGSIDKEFLEVSLNILFPHMVDCYTYLDFSEFSVPGGIDKLTHTVKVFAGSRLPNQIVALFDNDTAGVKEYQLLKKITLPENIKITTLPDIKLAENYPTIGPSGNVLDNVNGRACGIEMYLGEDVLRDSAGNLEPIFWGGYIEAFGYQGKLQKKAEIQKRFRKKVREVSKNKKNVKLQDWSGMCSIWERVFTLNM